MRTPALLAALLAIALCLVAAPARGYDPLLEWHTLETPHFVVHYHDGLGALAQRTARALEAAHKRLVPALGHDPDRRVQVVLSDETDSANGSATVWLRPTINFLAVPPDSRSELNDYEDYVWNLVTHEYTHILHMDEISGVPAIVNKVLGQMWIPNAIQPRWYLEGLAVYEESAMSGSGRERSSLFDMFIRSEVLEHSFFQVDDVTGYPSVWPGGALAYLHGSRFLQWVADTYGPQVFAQMSHDYGSQIIPFGINATAKEHLGSTWISLYKAWEQELTSQIEGQVDQIRSRGATEPRRLTFLGVETGEPTFIDGERILYLESSSDRRSAVREVKSDGTGDRLVREVYGGGTLALAKDKSFAVVSQMVTFQEYYFYEDLFRLDLKSNALTQLTFGARLTEPDLSPDGQTIVAARRLGGGRTGLVVLPAGGGPIRTVYEAPEVSVVYTPRFSPDGTTVAFSEQRPGGRDIRLLRLDTGEVTDVTCDRAIDMDPTFDPTGRYLLFVSDRTGVFNVYARELESGQTLQVTNVLTGAFKPAVSPDGNRLALVTYSTVGYDVSVVAYSPEEWKPAPAVDLQRPPPPDWEGRETYPTRPYQPIRTMYPLYWLPVLGSDAKGMTVGISTAGADVVGLHAWALQAEFGIFSKEPSVSASYGTQLWYPYLDLNAGTFLTNVPNSPITLLERQYYGSASLTFPYTKLDESFYAQVSYGLRYYAPEAFPLPTNPLDDPPFHPDRGLSAALALSIGYSSVQGFGYGISPERGIAINLSLRGARPEWGSQFRYVALSGNITGYLAMPWLAHHVVAAQISGGMSSGDLVGQFGLGGLPIHDPVLDLLRLSGISGAGLRGYPSGAFAGSLYTLANVEYRFPIIRVDGGLWTLPFYLKRIHGAVTFDIGEATDSWTWRELKPSVGAELRAELYLGYALSTTLRLGYARGLAKEGVNDFFLGLGNSF